MFWAASEIQVQVPRPTVVGAAPGGTWGRKSSGSQNGGTLVPHVWADFIGIFPEISALYMGCVPPIYIGS